MVQDGKARALEDFASLEGSDEIDEPDGSVGSDADRPDDFSARA